MPNKEKQEKTEKIEKTTMKIDECIAKVRHVCGKLSLFTRFSRFFTQKPRVLRQTTARIALKRRVWRVRPGSGLPNVAFWHNARPKVP